jgi:hypothetical protein
LLDELTTGANSSAVTAEPDGSQLTIGPNTIIKMSGKSHATHFWKTLLGRTWWQIVHIADWCAHDLGILPPCDAVAISNHRLVALDNNVTFRWRDSAHGNRKRMMSLPVDEFLRRFLRHVLPSGFVRIRNFGFLANRQRAALVSLWVLLSQHSAQYAERAASFKSLYPKRPWIAPLKPAPHSWALQIQP